MASTDKQSQQIPNVVKFIFGGTAGYLFLLFNFFLYNFINNSLIFDHSMAATCFVQPLDLVKNRMQLSGLF